MAYVVICICFALATGIIGRAKGSSFLIWFVIGGVLPLLGLVAVILYRREHHKLYVQVCTRCGEDMYLPDPAEVRPAPDLRRSGT
jgi:hypothetical protein